MPIEPTEGDPHASQPAPNLDASLEDELGAPRRFAPEDDAPPVDHEKLRKYLRQELSENARQEISGLIAVYRSWNNAWRDALIADADSTENGPRE